MNEFCFFFSFFQKLQIDWSYFENRTNFNFSTWHCVTLLFSVCCTHCIFKLKLSSILRIKKLKWKFKDSSFYCFYNRIVDSPLFFRGILKLFTSTVSTWSKCLFSLCMLLNIIIFWCDGKYCYRYQSFESNHVYNLSTMRMIDSNLRRIYATYLYSKHMQF